MTRALLLCLLLAGCAAVPVDCACDEKREPLAQPLDEPELVHCQKVGDRLYCYHLTYRT